MNFLDVKGCLKKLGCAFSLFLHGKSPCFLMMFSAVGKPEQMPYIHGSLDGVVCLG